MLLLLLAPGGAHAFGPLSTFGQLGAGAGQVGHGAGLAVGADGTVYVADSVNNRIDVFAPDGAFIRAFGSAVNPAGGNVCTTATGCKAGTGTSLPGGLVTPLGVAIGPEGNLYIAEGGSHRVSVFTPGGSFIRAFGKDVNPKGGNVCTEETGCWGGTADSSAGSLGSPVIGPPTPTGLDVDSNGLVYIASTSERIEVYTTAGSFVRAFGRKVNPAGGDVCTAATGCQAGGEWGVAGGIGNAWDVAVSDDGRVAVSDGNNRRVSIFESDGTFVRAFGEGVNVSAGSGVVGTCTAATGCRQGAVSAAAGGFAYTLGISLGPSGNLLAADFSNHRIDEFGFDGTFVRAFGEGVVNGNSEFQVCTPASGCRQGLNGAGTNSTGWPMGVGLDCRGAIYASLSSVSSSPTLVKRFGDSGAGIPPCPPPPSPGVAPAATPSAPAPSVPAPAPPPPPVRRFQRPTLEIELNKGSGTASLTVIVSTPGVLILKGKGIRKVKRRAKRPGLYELPVSTRGRAARKLRRRGKLKVKLLLVFRPNQGRVSRQLKVVKLLQRARF